jgi:hypothetical protein
LIGHGARVDNEEIDDMDGDSPPFELTYHNIHKCLPFLLNGMGGCKIFCATYDDNGWDEKY